jgi:hypothetical protein
MRYGAHLPLIDFDGRGWRPGELASYADAARRLGYGFVSANDHLVFQRPWLDGIVALAAVLEHSGDMQLATTTPPAVRGPPRWPRRRPRWTSSPAAGSFSASGRGRRSATMRPPAWYSRSAGHAWTSRSACCGLL